MNKPVLILTLLVILAAAGILLFSFGGSKTQAPQSVQNREQIVPPTTPAPTSIRAGTVQGTVVSVADSSLVVQTDSGDVSVSLAGTNDFQKIVSVSSAGVPEYAAATKADIKAGQQVKIAINKTTGTAYTVIILK